MKRLMKRLGGQSGRTLLEMLGVLVIIGILSLASLIGYQYAMESIRLNETLNRYSKIVAGARTGRILQTLGEQTKYDIDTGALRIEFMPQRVNMNDVISNIGGDIIVHNEASYVLCPLKGSVKDGTEQPVEIYCYVETPEAFTVYADNLTMEACLRIISTDLGNDFAFEAEDNTQDWLPASITKQKEIAIDLCTKVIGNSDKRGTLVLWFGPYECMGTGCVSPSCKGAECCCETTGTKTKLKNPAPTGCAQPNGGTCLACAEPNAFGICTPKDGYTSCQPSCTVGICSNQNRPFYCGNGLCCKNADDCAADGCKSGDDDTPACKEPRPVVCGRQCCSLNEECVADKLGVKRCEPRPTPGSCNFTQTPCYDQNGLFTGCCADYQVCNIWGECDLIHDVFPDCVFPRFKCAEDCCTPGQICKNGKCENQCPKDKPVPCPKAPNCCTDKEVCVNGKCKECINECAGKSNNPVRAKNGDEEECCCIGWNGGRIVNVPDVPKGGKK